MQDFSADILEDDMNHGDFGWKTMIFTGEALMAASVAAGVALLAALVLGLL